MFMQVVKRTIEEQLINLYIHKAVHDYSSPHGN